MFSAKTDLSVANKQLTAIQEIIENVSKHADVITIDELQRKLELLQVTAVHRNDTSHSFILIVILITFVVALVFVIGLLRHPCMRNLLTPNSLEQTARTTTPKTHTAVNYEEPHQSYTMTFYFTEGQVIATP